MPIPKKGSSWADTTEYKKSIKKKKLNLQSTWVIGPWTKNNSSFKVASLLKWKLSDQIYTRFNANLVTILKNYNLRKFSLN